MLCPSCEARYGKGLSKCPVDGTALAAIDDTVGKTLSGTYFVRRVLGEGAMGRVFEARHTRVPAKRFAVKLLHPEYLGEPQILARFAREAEAAATIVHPNVSGIIDVDRTPDGRPFLVSELLEGKDFGDYLMEKGKLPVAAAVRIGLQIAAALAAAHARGIIHRDVKPENVFLTGDLSAPVAKVLDFGMSRLEGRDGRPLTMAGAVVGTPSFMPPEQARGDRVDHRADIYALGAILYTALTGQRPFDRETPAATLLAVLGEEPPRPRALDPAIPEALEQVILRAMARDPDQRYPTMEDLSRALARCEVRVTLPDSPSAEAARAGVAGAGPARVTTLRDEPQDRLTAHARPALAALVAAAFVWAGGALSAALATLVKAAHGTGDTLSGGETAMIVTVVLAALGAPLYVGVNALTGGVWSKPAQAAAGIRRVAPPLLGALAAYGVASSLVRGLEGALLGVRAPWAGWDMVLFLVGLAGAGLPLVVQAELSRQAAVRGR
jgi:serine/threonine-protein kinase